MTVQKRIKQKSNLSKVLQYTFCLQQRPPQASRTADCVPCNATGVRCLVLYDLLFLLVEFVCGGLLSPRAAWSWGIDEVGGWGYWAVTAGGGSAWDPRPAPTPSVCNAVQEQTLPLTTVTLNVSGPNAVVRRFVQQPGPQTAGHEATGSTGTTRLLADPLEAPTATSTR